MPRYVAVTIIKSIFHYCGVIFSRLIYKYRTGKRSELPKNFEMWCWRRMLEIICTSRVRNVKVFHRVKEERNILRAIQRMKANWLGYILRRNCLLKHVIEGKIERRGR